MGGGGQTRACYFYTVGVGITRIIHDITVLAVKKADSLTVGITCIIDYLAVIAGPVEINSITVSTQIAGIVQYDGERRIN